MQLHDLTALEHLGAYVIREANQQLNHWHRYAAPVKISSPDVLYRPGPLAGSFIFYDVLTARHPKTSDGKGVRSDVIRAKVTNRNKILNYRKLLQQLQDAAEELYPD